MLALPRAKCDAKYFRVFDVVSLALGITVLAIDPEMITSYHAETRKAVSRTRNSLAHP